MTKVLIIGASRGIGLETVRCALEADCTVRAFSRKAQNIALDNPNLEKFSGDALNAEDITRALQGIDVVIQVLGAPFNSETVIRGTRLFSDSTRVLIDCIEAVGASKRLICVTGLGAGDSRVHLKGMYRLLFTLGLARMYDDKDVQEQMVRNSKLDWTIVRPGLLTDGRATGVYQVLVEPDQWRAAGVRRADVGLFLVDEALKGTYRGKTPVIIG
ncbi:MAG: NAD(P)H-binding protein [Filomicrobium sp.]